jgi:hypothetical protein
MSVDLIVFAARAAVPSPTDWQRAIEAAEFPVTLDTDFNVDTFSGFLPCTFRSLAAGFEYFASALSPEEGADAGAPEGTDFQVTLVTHSDLREFATSLLAAAALCHASGGLLVEPQSGEEIKADRVLDWARACLKEIDRVSE